MSIVNNQYTAIELCSHNMYVCMYVCMYTPCGGISYQLSGPETTSMVLSQPCMHVSQNYVQGIAGWLSTLKLNGGTRSRP